MTIAAANSAAGFAALESGLLYRFGSSAYIGTTAGLGINSDETKPVFSVRLGAARPTSRYRLELRANSPVNDGLHPSVHAIFGYSMRPWSGPLGRR